jgi:hypothetical protein
MVDLFSPVVTKASCNDPFKNLVPPTASLIPVKGIEVELGLPQFGEEVDGVPQFLDSRGSQTSRGAKSFDMRNRTSVYLFE